MIGQGLLVVAAITGGYWLLDLAGFRMRVPLEHVARGRSWLAWQVAPLGLACLVLAAVVLPWEMFGAGPGDSSGPYVTGAVGLVAFAIARLWPQQKTPDPSWHQWMQRIYVVVAVLSVALIVSGPFIPD